ncbi:MAG TPA: CoA-binding protein [Bacteroidales bacterium]|nr:CoA-binding protein [Bacteroidales bacterium]
MVTLKQIEEFLASEPIALAGVSRNPRKFGYTAFKELKEKGMNVIPVNPHADEILGSKAFKDVSSLPPEVKGLIIMTRKDQTAGVIKEAREKGIKQIWIQQMSDNKDVIQELEGDGINLITKECILMHYKPHSIHKFHRAILKFFGRLPK